MTEVYLFQINNQNYVQVDLWLVKPSWHALTMIDEAVHLGQMLHVEVLLSGLHSLIPLGKVCHGKEWLKIHSVPQPPCQ